MCVIITLEPGASINKDHLWNAVRNNWHGYGLILKDGNNKLQVIKKFYKDGTDPEEVWKLLEDNKDIFRFLHLRHATKGAQDETNLHPFNVYESDSRQIYFAHNGTLSSFGGSYNNTDGLSDTADFCQKILRPGLLRWSGAEGKADYTDEEFYRLIMEKHWTSGSTGLFVSNDLESVRIGSGWSEYKHPNDSSSGLVWTSNTSYFDRVQRGPYFQMLEQAKKEEEKKRRQEALANGSYGSFPEYNGYSEYGGYSNSNQATKWNANKASKDPKIIKAINDIVDTWDFDDPQTVLSLRNATYEELHETLAEMDEWSRTAVFDCLIDTFYTLYKEVADLRRAKKGAEKRLREISGEKKNGKEAA